MKLKHKVLIASLSLIAIVSTVVTFALLTFETDTLVNTFTVGQVSLKLDETDVDETGTPIPGAERVTGNEYKLIPGKSYVKDPTMTVLSSSEASYVRLLLTITKAKELKEVLGSNFLPENYVTGWDKTKWLCTSIKENQDNSITYEFRYHEVVAGYVDGKTEDVVLTPLFTSFTAPAELTNEDLKKIEGFEIKVVGHGIQATGFKSADEAWNAFNEENK
jgi:hypothetical protein